MSGAEDRLPNNRSNDRRVQRTQAALREAFTRLILSEGYDALNAAKIAAAANVGRSTFYEHYRSVEDMLAQSIEPLLLPLADSVFARRDRSDVLAVVEHFWANRQLARRLMGDNSYMSISKTLADLVQARLEQPEFALFGHSALLPPALAATQIASCQLALIQEWLTGRHGCSAVEIAAALEAVSYAIPSAIGMRAAMSA